MKKLHELKPLLEHGDNIRISKISKVPKSTVDSILCGARNAETPAGEKIRIAAQKLIDSRKALFDDTDEEEQPEPSLLKE
ncbi:hypothetical protein [Pontibacter litorisediminis]|uniref:hypothetical protein n=1 Tax=Pontibacter litorisediminis TaxID=1846260 RepID=UPI0023EBFB2F|nr:hypothetical protein [Pontibacter litorisediminis]